MTILERKRWLSNLSIEPYSKDSRKIISSEFKKYIELTKEEMLGGRVSISPDKELVDPDVWNKCKILSNKGFVIGGSVVLNLYGFIKREIGDIDLFLSTEKIEFDTKSYEKIYSDNEDGDYDEDDMDRMKISVPGIGIMDVFNFKVDYYMYDGVKIESPFSALKAKISYHRDKDIRDFIYMAKNV